MAITYWRINASDKLSGKPNIGEVIVETEESHHMTGEYSLLTNVVSISPCSVGFADICFEYGSIPAFGYSLVD